MTPIEILRDARTLIAEPEHWCQGAFAKRSDGRQVFPGDWDAAQWCAVGAVYRAAGSLVSWTAVPLAVRVALTDAAETTNGSVVEFNDNGTHADVLALYDAAIAALEATP
jgi:hypothetical protein